MNGQEKMHACWRGYKCGLKVALFDGRSHDKAITKRSEHISLETWANLVQFWESDKGKVIMCFKNIYSYNYFEVIQLLCDFSIIHLGKN